MICPCAGTVDKECHLLGMLPSGQLSGHDEPHKSDVLPLSPKRQDLQRKKSQSPKVVRSLRQTLQKCLQGQEDNSLHDLSSVETICTKADHSSLAYQDGIGVVEDTLPMHIEKIRNIEEKKEREDEEAGEGSSKLVEHIFKELLDKTSKLNF